LLLQVQEAVMSQSTGSVPDGTYSGRLEVVGGSTGRRRWPDALKARIVQESFAPGASVSAVARRHGISPQQLTGWRRAARDGILPLDGDQMDTARDTPAFVPLEVADPAGTEAEPGATEEVVEIVAGSVTVRLPADTDATRIATVAAELAARR
jgi:transposase